MSLRCNIDAKGRLVRMIYGAVFVIAGIVLMVAWALRTGSVTGWVASSAAIVVGAFAIFESRAGWCVVRAMGFKTRI